jgi:WhiB family transcriptional regulator, redox-sensing transcriptional regulator
MHVTTTTRPRSVEWASHGACRHEDPDLFFPITSIGPARAQIAEAKEVCAHCEVRVDCLAYALETGQDCGIWGGMTEDERRARRLRDRRSGERAIPGPRRPVRR